MSSPIRAAILAKGSNRRMGSGDGNAAHRDASIRRWLVTAWQDAVDIPNPSRKADLDTPAGLTCRLALSV
jgi:molybdopterin-guanine dinucleotide biosynthesis protein A